MPIIAKESGTDFKPVSPGTKGARCFGVVDLGTQLPNIATYRPQRKVLLFWEIAEECYEVEGKQIPMTIMREYSLTLGKANKESNLRKDLNSWRGRPFTEDEAKGFDIKALIGVPCMLSIAHYKKQDGNTGAKVAAVTGVPKGLIVPELIHDKLYYEIDMGKGKEFEALPEWIRGKVSKCLEWCPTDTHVPTSVAQDEEPADDSDVPFALMPPWLPFAASAAVGLIA